MAKPIRLTDTWIQKLTEEFMDSLKKLKLSEGKVSYSKSISYEDKDGSKAVVLFEPVAYAKMLMVLHTFSKEVAWHGVVEREDETHFIIKDILVYPQTVTGTTVTTDQEYYQTWLMELDEDTFNNLHMQGHSHVNMATSPSSVDSAFYDSIVSQLGSEDYYIFMIFNKRLEFFVNIYDMKANILYETKDVSIGIKCEGGDLDQFIIDAKDDVVETTYVYTPRGSAFGGNTTSGLTEKSFGKKNEEKSLEKNSDPMPGNGLNRYPGYYGGYGSGGYDGYPDFDEEIFGKRAQWFPNK